MNKVKSIFLTFLSYLFMLSFAVAQQNNGIVFFKGTWSELLATAKKQSKPIFIDVYTDWCPPCKRMDKEIFPLKEVGHKYNTMFINYRLDAEKGEGIENAKKYGVKAYPTYLYLDDEGRLLHRAVDFMPAAIFISHADKAISLLPAANNISQLEKEFKAGNRKPDFLQAYIRKMKELGLDNSEVLNAYFKARSVKQLATPTELVFIGEQINSIRSAALVFLMEHFDNLEKEQKEKLANKLYKQVLYTAFTTSWKESRPVELKQVMAYIDLLEKDISEKNLIGVQRLRTLYYTMVKDTAKLKQTAYLMLSNTMAISLDSIHAEDVKRYEEVMKPYWSGKLDSTRVEGFQQEKKYVMSQYSAQISSILYELANAFSDTLDARDPALKEALSWVQRAKLIAPANQAIIALEVRLKKIMDY